MNGHYLESEKHTDEIFIGNIAPNEFPKPYFKDLKTIRIGSHALDIFGEPLHGNYMRPLFVNKSEYDLYNHIMATKTKWMKGQDQ